MGDAGLHFDQATHHGLDIPSDKKGAAIREDFGVELEPSGALMMAGAGARIIRHRINEAVRNVKLAAVNLPQVIMGELMAEKGLQLMKAEQGKHRAGEDNVRLAWYVIESRV